MTIERTCNNQIIITVSSSVDSFGLQRLIDYMKYLEATAKSKAKQTDVDKLADEVNALWWEKKVNDLSSEKQSLMLTLYLALFSIQREKLETCLSIPENI